MKSAWVILVMFLSIFSSQVIALPGEKGQRWAKVDSNGDGLISRTEFMAQAEVRFNAADRNGDGLISQEERQQMRQELRKLRAKAHGEGLQRPQP